MSEQQKVINAIRCAVLDKTGQFTIFDLFELPRTGRLLRNLQATFEDVDAALKSLRCIKVQEAEGTAVYIAPRQPIHKGGVFIL